MKLKTLMCVIPMKERIRIIDDDTREKLYVGVTSMLLYYEDLQRKLQKTTVLRVEAEQAHHLDIYVTEGAKQ